MPTYVCSVPPNLLSAERKGDLARAITRIHSEATGAPAYFVQVVIEESVAATHYLGGAPAEGQVWIRGDIRAGRSEGVRKSMMLAIMRAAAEIVGIGESEVWVYLCNLAPTDMVEYGHVLPAPGEEQAWFEALPAELRARLAAFGASAATFRL